MKICRFQCRGRINKPPHLLKSYVLLPEKISPLRHGDAKERNDIILVDPPRRPGVFAFKVIYILRSF